MGLGKKRKWVWSAAAHEVARAVRTPPGIGFSMEVPALDGGDRVLILANQLLVILRRHQHGLVGRKIEGLNIDALAWIF